MEDYGDIAEPIVARKASIQPHTEEPIQPIQSHGEPIHSERDEDPITPHKDPITDDEPFVCPHCGKSYGKWASFSGHVLGAHGGEARKALDRSDYPFDDVETGGKVSKPKRKSNRKEPKVPKIFTEDDFEGYDDDIDELLEDEEVTISRPSSLTKLGNIMRETGWNKYIKSIVKEFKSKDSEDIPALIRILSDYDNNKSKIRRTVRRYVEDIGIPQDDLDEDVYTLLGYYRENMPVVSSPSYPRRRGRSFDDYSSNPSNQLLEQVRAFKEIKEVFNPDDGEGYSESEEIKDLQHELELERKENESLKQEIKFQKMIDDAVKPLKEENEKLRANQGDFKQQFDGVKIDGLKQIMETAKEMKDGFMDVVETVEESKKPAPNELHLDPNAQRRSREFLAEFERQSGSKYISSGPRRVEPTVHAQGLGMERRQDDRGN